MSSLASYLDGFLLVVFAYIVGSVSTGYIYVRLKYHRDIRDYGSGSVGARNVGRQFGKSDFLLTLLGDFSKGALVVMLANYLEYSHVVVSCIAIMVVAGHIWPIFLGFRGGKGLATACGAFIVLDWVIVVIAMTISLLTYTLKRNLIKSMAVSCIVLPVVVMFIGYDIIDVAVVALTSMMIMYAHRDNILRNI